MKKLFVLIFAVALSVAAFAAVTPKDIALDAPTDASRFVAGGGTVATIRVLSIDYVTGTYRFQLLTAGGIAVGNGAVFGAHDDTPSESRVKAAVVAGIQAAG